MRDPRAEAPAHGPARSPAWIGPAKRVSRMGLAVVVMAAAMWIAMRELRALEAQTLLRTLRSIPSSAVAASIAFTIASYACLAVQEGYGLRLLRRRLPPRRVAANAFVANALAGVLGFGLVSGTALRLRLYRGVRMTAVRIGKLGLILSLATFLSGVSTLGIGVLARPASIASALRWPLGLSVFAALLMLAPAALWLVPLRGEQRRMGARARLSALAASLADWTFAGAALFCLSGQGLAAFPTFLAVFCLGSLIGSLAGVPAGLGVLEATVLSLAAGAHVHETTAALIVYRVVYFMGPAIGAAAMLGLDQAAEIRPLPRPGAPAG